MTKFTLAAAFLVTATASALAHGNHPVPVDGHTHGGETVFGILLAVGIVAFLALRITRHRGDR